MSDLQKCLNALYLVLDETVAGDVARKVNAELADKDAEIAHMQSCIAELTRTGRPGETVVSSATFSALHAQLTEKDREIERMRKALEKIADPTKRDHKEPDAYTTLGCVMNIAEEALAREFLKAQGEKDG